MSKPLFKEVSYTLSKLMDESNDEQFYIRAGGSSAQLTPSQMTEYIRQRFKQNCKMSYKTVAQLMFRLFRLYLYRN